MLVSAHDQGVSGVRGEVTEGHSVWQCHQVMKDDDEDLSVMPLGTHNEGVGNGGCHLSHFVWQCHHE